MTPEQWARVKDVFSAALAQEASRRRGFVAEASGGDEAVRVEVERLLDADLRSSGFIEYSALDTLLSGRVISHYEIGRLVGTGGMGRVYAARDIELGRDVALKVASLDSEDSRSRLLREAQHASRLSHPHICHIYEVGRAEGQLFIVMELVPGRSLADLLREGPLSIANAMRYGAEIADALAHAHEQGLIHRDLKSTNVMITPRRGAKVLDFGLAKTLDADRLDALSHSQRSLTAEGMIAGTLPYMAPELLRGQRGDQRADIWALGVLLYEMVSGHRPFSGATGFELSAAILSQPPDPLPSARAPLHAIIQRCLEKDPNDRYQHAADVHLALQKMQGASPVHSVRLFATPRSLVGNLLLVVIALTVAGILFVLYDGGSAMFSNARGYSWLEEGAFERAVEEFQAVTEREPDDANAWDSLGEGYLASGAPDRSLDAYSRALAIDPTYEPSILGRGLALAALGRYDEALANESQDFHIQAFLLSRVGRYREAADVLAEGLRAATADDETDAAAGALLTWSWLRIEQQHYPRALEDIRAAKMLLAPEGDVNDPLLVVADLLSGVAAIRAGKVQDAVVNLASQKSHAEGEERVEANWVAALEAEIALAHGQHDRAMSHFNAARTPAWLTLGRGALAIFAMNPPSRDGPARVEISRGNRTAAIDEYRRLTTEAAGNRSSAALEPRHILALARLLDEHGDAPAARVEYERFLKLWANADEGLAEVEAARRAVARLSTHTAR